MRDKYDFSEGILHPYVKKVKTAVTIRLDQSIVDYFKTLSEQGNLPYQTLINSYLADCALKQVKPSIHWG